MLNSRQKKILSKFSSKEKVPFSVWQELNDINESDSLEGDIEKYYKEEYGTENTSDLRYMRKANRAEKKNKSDN